MKLTKFFVFFIAVAIFAACQKEPTQLNPGGYTGENKDISNENITKRRVLKQKRKKKHLTEVPRPQKIVDMMAARGNQDKAVSDFEIYRTR